MSELPTFIAHAELMMAQFKAKGDAAGTERMKFVLQRLRASDAAPSTPKTRRPIIPEPQIF